MTIELDRETRQPLIASIRRYFEEDLEQPIGDLRASLVLDFVLAEIAPTVYNHAIRDAQAWLAQRVADLDGSCWEPEQTFWKP